MNSGCQTCKPCLPCDNCILRIKQILNHWCDGPITDFVLISRATELAVDCPPEVVANALHQALLEYGYLKPNLPIFLTGS